MLKPHIEDGVKGDAIPIALISESFVDRAVFNFIVHVRYNRELRTSEEINDIWENYMGKDEFNTAIQEALRLITFSDEVAKEVN